MRSKVIKLAGRKLVGEWHHAESAKRLIVICHGFKSSSEDPTLIAIADGLNKSGHDTFIFDFSENSGGFDIEHQVQDISHVTEYFKNYSEIVLLAASFAALTAAIATIQIPAVTKLVTLNGFFGSGELGGKHRKNYLKFKLAALIDPSYKKILKYYRKQLQPQRITVPVLVIHSQVDEYVFFKQSRNFYEKLMTPKHFVILKKANHGIIADADREIVVFEINQWLKLIPHK